MTKSDLILKIILTVLCVIAFPYAALFTILLLGYMVLKVQVIIQGLHSAMVEAPCVVKKGRV